MTELDLRHALLTMLAAPKPQTATDDDFREGYLRTPAIRSS